mgnify:CR=1 FL=1
MSNDTEPTTAIVPAQPAGIVRAVVGPEAMAGALEEYRQLQAVLDRAMPETIMLLDGKPFRKKAYWRAVATAFNLDLQLVSESRWTVNNDWGYDVVYRAVAPNGRGAAGEASCAASEKRGVNRRGEPYDHATVHNVRSHAHTRAVNRAISNLVGFGEVSAEEANEAEYTSARRTQEARARPTQESAGTHPVCPKCGSGLWDNREQRKEGSKRPAARCRSKDCEFVVWELADADALFAPPAPRHHPTWTQDHKLYCASLDAARPMLAAVGVAPADGQTTYDAVAAACEAAGLGRPSTWERADREAFLSDIRTGRNPLKPEPSSASGSDDIAF